MFSTGGRQCNQSAALIAMTAMQAKVSFKGTHHICKVTREAGRGCMGVFRWRKQGNTEQEEMLLVQTNLLNRSNPCKGVYTLQIFEVETLNTSRNKFQAQTNIGKGCSASLLTCKSFFNRLCWTTAGRNDCCLFCCEYGFLPGKLLYSNCAVCN